MSEKKVFDELQNIFRDVFDDKSIELTRDTDADSIEDWDSLSHIRLIAAIEKCFNIKFSFRELQNMDNVGDMIDIIDSKQKS